jgi:SPP1 gp7 family putative phage head morphogenesis protein
MAKKTYIEEKLSILDNNYYRYVNETLRDIQDAYKQAYKDIEREIQQWYLRMNDIKSINPDFKFSELHQLQDLKKQIDIILEELAQAESKALESGMKNLYVSDYMDLGKMNEKYVSALPNTPLPQFNQLQAPQLLETYLNMGLLNKTITKEIAKNLDLEMFYDGIQGKWHFQRIEERAAKLGYSIEQKLRQAIIRQDSYSKVASTIAKDLDISFSSAKTLVRTEMATVENAAVVHNAQKLGYNGLKFSTYHDSHVCEICESMDGKVFPVEEVRAEDFIMHPNCRCTLVEVVLDENGKPIESSFKNEAEEYLKKKATERKQEAERIRNMHMKKK